MNFAFLQLPLDNKLDVILNLDVETLAQFCLSNAQINALCNNERVWKEKFAQLSKLKDINQHHIPSELAQSWKERTQLLWNILHPDRVFTLYQIDPDADSDIFDPEYTYPHLIIGNIRAKDLDSAKQCIVDSYNSYKEPIYSSLNSFITDIINESEEAEDEEYEHNPLLLNRLNNIFTEKKGEEMMRDMRDQGLTVERLDYLLKLQTNGPVFYELKENLLIRFGSDVQTYNLLVNDSDEMIPTSIRLTVSGVNESQMKSFLAVLLNYSHLFYQDEEDEEYDEQESAPEGEEVGDDFLEMSNIIKHFFKLISLLEAETEFRRPEVYDFQTISDIMEKAQDLSELLHYYLIPGTLINCV